MPELTWLPPIDDWRPRLRDLAQDNGGAWDKAVALANTRLDFVRTNALDETLRRAFRRPPPPDSPPGRCGSRCSAPPRWRICMPAIRVAGLRRGIWIDDLRERLRPVLAGTDRSRRPGCTRSSPTAVLFALDALPPRRRRHRGPGRGRRRRRAGRDHCGASANAGGWRARRSAARSSSRPRCRCIPPLLGNNEHRLPGSRAALPRAAERRAARHGRCRRRRSAGAR